MIKRINHHKLQPKVIEGMRGLYPHLTSIDAKLKALVELRVSQINGCVFCCDKHSQEARAAGENQQRLDCLPAWQECTFFSDRERAALAWAESVTRISETGAPDDVYDNLKPHFLEQEIVDLTLIISLMNAWNRIAIGFRNVPDARKAGA